MDHTHTHRVNVTEAVQVHIVMRRYPSLAALSYSPRQQHDTSAIMPPTTKSNGEACCSPRAIYNISFRRPSNFRVHDLFLFLEEEEFKGIEGKPIGQRVQLELIRIEDKK